MDLESKTPVENCPKRLLLFSALPQALAMALCISQMPELLRTNALFTALMALWGVSALASMIYAFLGRKCTSIPQPVLLFCAAQSMLTYLGMMLLTYPMPRTTHLLNLEVTLLFLTGFQAVGMSYLLLRSKSETDPGEPFAVQRDVNYGFLLPFLCAVAFSLFRNANYITDLLFSLAIGMLCLSVLFGVRWMGRFIGRDVPIAAPESLEAEPEENVLPPFLRRYYSSNGFLLLFAMILPIVGLRLNQAMGEPFLDASSPLLLIIAVANGLLMLPVMQKRQSLVYLYLQAVGLTYLFYFVLVFLPFTLHGVVLLLVAVGALILTPLILFLIETRQIIKRVKNLCAKHRRGTVVAVLIVGILTLPVLVGSDILIDRANYQKAVGQMDDAQNEDQSPVNLTRLSNMLDHLNDINGNFERHFDVFMRVHTDIYSRILCNGIMPTHAQVTQLHSTYFAKEEAVTPNLSSWGITNRDFRLLSHDVRTEYNEAAGAYQSWVDLIIKNKGHDNNEFTATFAFPASAFVVDYSLYVGAVNKQGLLSEKRAAQMVYEKIVKRSQDPGILFYQSDNTLQLNVFPFAKDEVRRTGFCVMHIEPLEIVINGQAMVLDAPKRADLHSPMVIPGHSAACHADSCTEQLPAQANEYDNAMILMHNTKIDPSSLDLVADSFAQRVLTPSTAFIVLESAMQEYTLRMLQQRIMNGEHIPERFISMDEPSLWVVLAAVCIGLYVAKKRRRQMSDAQ